MVQVNAIGDAWSDSGHQNAARAAGFKRCGTVQTLVDNEIAVQNLTRLAESKGALITTEKRSDRKFWRDQSRLKIPSARQKPMSRLPARYRRRRKRQSLSFPPTIWARAMRNWAVF